MLIRKVGYATMASATAVYTFNKQGKLQHYIVHAQVGVLSTTLLGNHARVGWCGMVV